jgi:peptide/nickel transport system substrate-binding protein
MTKKILPLSLVFVLLLVACAPSAIKRNNRLVVAIPTDPDGFHPHISVAAATSEIAFNIFEGLVKAGPGGEIIPALAEDWQISADGLTYTFILRQGVMFHNGRELTADDVVYSLSRVSNPEISAKARDYGAVQAINAQEDQIIIQLSRPNAAFLSLLTSFGASIYPQEAEEQLGARPVGTGPFRLESWHPNNKLELVRFDDYWGEKPQLERVTLQIIPDPTTAVNNLITGNVNLIARLEPAFLHQVQNRPNLKIIDSPMNLVQLMVINQSRAPFNDIRVRQAMAHAINRDGVITGAAWGYGSPIGSNMSPAMGEWYLDTTGTYEFSQEKARQLLTEAGFPNGFRAVLHLPEPYRLHVSAGEVLADQLEQVGITLDLQIVDWGTWLERVYGNSEFELTIIGFTGQLDPHPLLNRYQTGSSRNFGKFSNAEFDTLLAQGITETNLDARKALYHRMQELLAQELPAIFIMDPNQLAVMTTNVEGWQTYPLYVLDFANIRLTE